MNNSTINSTTVGELADATRNPELKFLAQPKILYEYSSYLLWYVLHSHNTVRFFCMLLHTFVDMNETKQLAVFLWKGQLNFNRHCCCWSSGNHWNLEISTQISKSSVKLKWHWQNKRGFINFEWYATVVYLLKLLKCRCEKVQIFLLTLGLFLISWTKDTNRKIRTTFFIYYYVWILVPNF